MFLFRRDGKGRRDGDCERRVGFVILGCFLVMWKVDTYPQVTAPSIEIQVHDLRRRTNLHWAEIHYIVHLIVGFNLSQFAVVMELLQHCFRRLLLLGLDEIRQSPLRKIDSLERAGGGGSDVICM
jgi:hypothetical protein